MSFPSIYRQDIPRSREAAGEASRAEAIRVATGLFAQAGFRGTSIAKVAQEMGLSQSGLLHHFPTKNALLLAVLQKRDDEDSEFLGNLQDVIPLGWDAFDALSALIARNTSRPELVGLFVQVAAEASSPEHPGHAWLKARYHSMSTWLTDAIEHGQARGQMKQDTPVASVVRTTIAVIDGLQQQWLLDRTVPMVDEFNSFIRGLQVQWAEPDEQAAHPPLATPYQEQR